MDYPRIGVASLVVSDGCLLLARRDKQPEIDSWQLPGGYIQYGESPLDAAVRLTEQKAGLLIHPLKQGPYTNNLFDHGKTHTVTLYVLAEPSDSAETENLSPQWQWFSSKKLPHPLFTPLRILVEQHKSWLDSVGIDI